MARDHLTQTRCKTCGEPIRWARTEKGKAMPLNYDPDPAGNVFLGPAPYDETGRVLARVRADLVVIALATDDAGSVFMPHIATCTRGVPT